MGSQSGTVNHAENSTKNGILSGSQVIRAGRSISARAADLIKDSYCYRWLTKEPEPEVIVIDLRETYAVGPFIALLDRLIPHIEQAWQHSRGGAVVRSAYEQFQESVLDPLSETRGYELAATMLAPPEPPEQERQTTDDSASDEEQS
ncbi:hypothetical protein Har1130_04475 [Haloarcula sp. CBA1130]|uniref:hypothetical protein n=1 Tax=unclassified Haloarcula TaxID=2624677 RepID=UPI001248E761|nr:MULTISPECIES: hypothetical protein [unclassified Haloarcula]KAA9398368.1 hypothetical protein Har1129_09185 [Haloarcula sp. CBA1129]KAA9402037.1 hypothetical protein Har1130_04475 [Haloarcula sp. CBA1130]